MSELSITIGIIAVLASAVTAYFAFDLHKHQKISSGWLILAFAFLLVVFRRAIGLLTETGLFEIRSSLVNTENFLLLAISILNLWGFWELHKSFRKKSSR
jgi:hypothetical protein